MPNFSEVARNCMMDAIGGRTPSVDLGGGYVELRNGTQPTSVEDAATGTLIATCNLNDPATDTSSGGNAALTTPITGTCVNDADVDNITWCRYYSPGDSAMMDASVTVSGGGGEVIATKVDPLSGESVAITGTFITSEN